MRSRARRGRRAPRPVSLRFRIVATAVVFVVCLLFAEGIARWFAPQLPTWRGGDSGTVIMVGHPSRLWGMNSGVRENAGTTATINEKGLRGPLPEVPRPAGRHRILVLGDSTFFGHGVPDDGTMQAQLETLFRARGLDVEVLNGGVPGYSTEQSRLLLEQDGWAFEPTLVVMGNLWSDNNFDNFKDEDLLRTRAIFDGNPLAHSAFFQILAGTVDRFRGGRGARIVTWTRNSEWPTGGERRVPLRRYAENLDGIVREARSRKIGAAFIAPCNDELARAKASADGAVWYPYFDAQEAIAKHHGVPRAVTRDAFQAAVAANPDETWFLDQMHPSVVGHGVVAQSLFEALVAAGWPDDALLGRETPFDASGLVDPAGDGRAATNNPLSPQVNLFLQGAGPDEVAAIANGGGVVVPGPPAANASASGWDIHGAVSGGSGPIRVQALSAAGDPLAVTNLAGPGNFSIRIREGVDEVTLVATGAGGETATLTTANKGEPVSLMLGP